MCTLLAFVFGRTENTVSAALCCSKGSSRVWRGFAIWNTRSNNGRAQERRVCVLSERAKGGGGKGKKGREKGKEGEGKGKREGRGEREGEKGGRERGKEEGEREGRGERRGGKRKGKRKGRREEERVGKGQRERERKGESFNFWKI